MLPKNRSQPKSKFIKINPRDGWEKILLEVDKNEIPVNVLQGLNVNLIDGTVVTISISELLHEGQSQSDIQLHLNRRLEDLHQYIADIDFFVDIDALAAAVQPVTDRILNQNKS